MQSNFTLQDAVSTLQSGKDEEAKKMFDAIVRINPDQWHSWFYLGTIAQKHNHNGDALAYLYRAAELCPEESAIWNNLGTVLRREHHVEKAKEALLKGCELSPEDADLWSNLCTLYVNEGHPEDGLEYVNKALKFEPEHMNARWNKSLLLLETGQLEEGFKLYKHGADTGERFVRFPHKPRFNPAEHSGKRVLVYGEQGIGDEIMYYSLIPDLLRDVGSLIVECHPRLESLLNEAFPEVTTYTTRKEEVVGWTDEFDAVMSLGDVPMYYRKKPEDFDRKPYLSVNPEMKHEMRNRLLERAGEGPYLGIAWKGGYHKTRKDLRSIPLSDMYPLIKRAHDAGAKIVSFQYTPEAEMAVRQFEKEHGIQIHHWIDIVADKQGDYMKTAALLDCMDLTVTVNTSLVHLAGAIGKELWTLTPKGCAWRYWCWDDKMMWYDSVTQYRAGENKSWGPVLEKVTDDLGVKFDLLKSIEVAK